MVDYRAIATIDDLKIEEKNRMKSQNLPEFEEFLTLDDIDMAKKEGEIETLNMIRKISSMTDKERAGAFGVSLLTDIVNLELDWIKSRYGEYIAVKEGGSDAVG